MELFFNELSMVSPAADTTTARAWLLSLQGTVQAAAFRGLSHILHIHQGFWETRLTEGYSVADWLRDPTIDRERRRFLRSAIGKAPFLETLHDDAEIERRCLAEAQWEGQSGLGIGLAAIHDAPAVSLPASPFDVDPLSVVIRYVSEDDASEGVESVCNFHSPTVVERRAPWIAQRQQQEVRSGAELVRARDQLLKQLDFTDGAVEQLLALTGSEKTFPFVLRHLFALNERARTWDGVTPFSEGYPFPCSDESESTLAMYGQTRTFLCPDGERRVFSWHSKINYEKWRVHFIDSAASRRVLIGYVGKHLPLAG